MIARSGLGAVRRPGAVKCKVDMFERKLARKQHIVTRRLLANFVDGDGFLWVYEKNKPIRKSKPENECINATSTSIS